MDLLGDEIIGIGVKDNHRLMVTVNLRVFDQTQNLFIFSLGELFFLFDLGPVTYCLETSLRIIFQEVLIVFRRQNYVYRLEDTP